MKAQTKSGSNNKSKNQSSIDTLAIIKALGIGIIGSVLLIISYLLLEFSWTGLILYNDGLRGIYLVQMALLIFLIPVFTGALTAMVLSANIRGYVNAIVAGLISGITAGPGFTAVLSLLVVTYNMSQSAIQDWQAIHDTLSSNLTSTVGNYIFDPSHLLMFTVLSIMLSGVGGSLFYAISYFTGGNRKAKKTSGNANVRIITGMAALLLVLAIIVPAGAFIGMKAGMIGSQGFHYTITAQRLSDDAIMIKNNGGDKLSVLDPASPFIIYVGSSLGGYDMTNQTAAMGMNVTMDPAGGLGLSPGSTLTIKGKDIEALTYFDQAAGKNLTHVFVIGNAFDGRQLVYLETSV